MKEAIKYGASALVVVFLFINIAALLYKYTKWIFQVLGIEL